MKFKSSRVAALAVVAVAGCGDVDLDQEQLEQAVVVCARGATVQGIDVSYYQGTINWPAVHNAGKAFAIIRVADGTYFDTQFNRNWAGARSAGVIRGAYQFFHPGRDPIVQADFMLSHMGALRDDDLPPMLDLEATDGASPAHIVTSVRAWIDRVQARTGRRPLIYTGKYFWNDNVRSSGFTSYPLVIAQYGPRCPDLPTPWGNWFMWQYSSTGRVAGISGNVDTDVFNGSLADLRAAISGSAPSPTYGARYVAQSWPLAADGALMMRAGESTSAFIELRNSGTATWNTSTRFATTVPRDRRSVFAGSDWTSPSRPDTVTGTVAPGATYRFRFAFHAPAMPGTYTEHFGMVQEGVTWFSATGQGGPADNVIEARIVVTAAADAGVRDAGTADASTRDASTTDGGARDASIENDVAEDVSASDAGFEDAGFEDATDDARVEEDAEFIDDVTEDDAAPPPDDGGVAHAGEMPPEEPAPEEGGCTCTAAGTSSTRAAHGGWMLLGVCALSARVRRRRAR